MQPWASALWHWTRSKATLFLLLAVLATAALCYGKNEGSTSRFARQVQAKPLSHSVEHVHSIVLPFVEQTWPAGPNRDQFTALCQLCHSPRLALTQPPFSEKKWAEVVHKMVAVYGAPILPEQEKEIVAYLSSVQSIGR